MPAMTFREVNEKITRVGLPPIDRHARNRLLALAETETLTKAINRTATDPNAVKFLAKLFAEAGISSNAPTPPSMPRPAAAARKPNTAPISRLGSRTAESELPHSTQTPYQNDSARGFLSYHTYGGKAALSWEADMTRKGDLATVAIDAAMAVAERQYDWQNKLRIQITQSELPVVAAVFLGVLPGCEYGQHGADNTKGFSLQRQQGGRIFARVFAKDEPLRAVPIEAFDSFRVASLFIRQIRRNMPWLDATAVMGLIRATVTDYTPRQPGK